jgi:hypothetical protein
VCVQCNSIQFNSIQFNIVVDDVVGYSSPILRLCACAGECQQLAVDMERGERPLSFQGRPPGQPQQRAGVAGRDRAAQHQGTSASRLCGPAESVCRQQAVHVSFTIQFNSVQSHAIQFNSIHFSSVQLYLSNRKLNAIITEIKMNKNWKNSLNKQNPQRITWKQ